MLINPTGSFDPGAPEDAPTGGTFPAGSPHNANAEREAAQRAQTSADTAQCEALMRPTMKPASGLPKSEAS